jgi:hypothetical protein
VPLGHLMHRLDSGLGYYPGRLSSHTENETGTFEVSPSYGQSQGREPW